MKSFIYRIEDPNGMHARPAGRLATVAKQFLSDVRVRTEEKEAETQKTENSYGLSGLEISIQKALLGEDSERAMNIARCEGIILDTAVDKINEAFFDNFGDVIIEGDSSNYNIIEDYKEDIGEWILKEAE